MISLDNPLECAHNIKSLIHSKRQLYRIQKKKNNVQAFPTQHYNSIVPSPHSLQAHTSISWQSVNSCTGSSQSCKTTRSRARARCTSAWQLSPPHNYVQSDAIGPEIFSRTFVPTPSRLCIYTYMRVHSRLLHKLFSRARSSWHQIEIFARVVCPTLTRTTAHVWTCFE